MVTQRDTELNKTQLLMMTFKISQIIFYRKLAIAFKYPAFKGGLLLYMQSPFQHVIQD